MEDKKRNCLVFSGDYDASHRAELRLKALEIVLKNPSVFRFCSYIPDETEEQTNKRWLQAGCDAADDLIEWAYSDI